jgi:hypothetical protein
MGREVARRAQGGGMGREAGDEYDVGPEGRGTKKCV